MLVIATATVSGQDGAPIQPGPVSASAESTWGAVSVGVGFSFTGVASQPAVAAVEASAVSYGGLFIGRDLMVVVASAVSRQSATVTPPSPSGPQLTFHWST